MSTVNCRYCGDSGVTGAGLCRCLGRRVLLLERTSDELKRMVADLREKLARHEQAAPGGHPEIQGETA